jgi:hypothetical protein
MEKKIVERKRQKRIKHCDSMSWDCVLHMQNAIARAKSSISEQYYYFDKQRENRKLKEAKINMKGADPPRSKKKNNEIMKYKGKDGI